MATASFNTIYKKLIIEASIKNKVMQIFSDYCRKGINEIKPFFYLTAYAAENKLNGAEIEDAIYEIALDNVKKMEKSDKTDQTDETAKTEDIENKEVKEDVEAVAKPETPTAPATMSKEKVKEKIIEVFKKYIDTKESNITIRSYIDSFLISNNSQNNTSDGIIDYCIMRDVICELAMENCNKALNESKEDALKVTDAEIVQAFKDYTGKRIPNPDRKQYKPKDFDQEQLYKGIMVEYEHTNDINYALEIVIDHLVENPKYYDYLEKMEDQMEKNSESKEKNNDEEPEKEIKEDSKISDEIIIPPHLVKKTKIFELLKKKSSRIPTLPDSTLKALAFEIYSIMADNSKNVDDNGKMNRISVLLTKHNYIFNTELTNLFTYFKRIMSEE